MIHRKPRQFILNVRTVAHLSRQSLPLVRFVTPIYERKHRTTMSRCVHALALEIYFLIEDWFRIFAEQGTTKCSFRPRVFHSEEIDTHGRVFVRRIGAVRAETRIENRNRRPLAKRSLSAWRCSEFNLHRGKRIAFDNLTPWRLNQDACVRFLSPRTKPVLSRTPSDETTDKYAIVDRRSRDYDRVTIRYVDIWIQRTTTPRPTERLRNVL